MLLQEHGSPRASVTLAYVRFKTDGGRLGAVRFRPAGGLQIPPHPHMSLTATDIFWCNVPCQNASLYVRIWLTSSRLILAAYIL